MDELNTGCCHSVRSGQTSFYCRANQCSAEEGRQLKRGWLSSHSSCISLSQEDGDVPDQIGTLNQVGNKQISKGGWTI